MRYAFILMSMALAGGCAVEDNSSLNPVSERNQLEAGGEIPVQAESLPEGEQIPQQTQAKAQAPGEQATSSTTVTTFFMKSDISDGGKCDFSLDELEPYRVAPGRYSLPDGETAKELCEDPAGRTDEFFAEASSTDNPVLINTDEAISYNFAGSGSLTDKMWCTFIPLDPNCASVSWGGSTGVGSSGSGTVVDKAWCTFLPMDPNCRNEGISWGGNGTIVDKTWCTAAPLDPNCKEKDIRWGDGGSGTIVDKAWCTFLPFDPNCAGVRW